MGLSLCLPPVFAWVYVLECPSLACIHHHTMILSLFKGGWGGPFMGLKLIARRAGIAPLLIFLLFIIFGLAVADPMACPALGGGPQLKLDPQLKLEHFTKTYAGLNLTLTVQVSGQIVCSCKNPMLMHQSTFKVRYQVGFSFSHGLLGAAH